MTSSFTKKDLRFTFTLATNSRFAGVNNTLQISGLRATADINYPGPPSFPNATLRIYGLGQANMNALTGLTAKTLAYQRNSVLVEANSGSGFVAVFAGQIITAVPDYSGAPDVAFQISALTLGFDLLNPATPTSFTAGASFEQVISAIAQKMGRSLVNEGVSGVFSKAPYYASTAADQLRRACNDAGIAYYLDTADTGAVKDLTAPLGTVVIAPLGKARSVTPFRLTPSNGLVGYPSLNSVNLIGATAIFNQAFRQGFPVQIGESDQIGANGNWIIYECSHALSSLMPNGPWFTRFTAQPPVGFVDIPGGL